MNICIFGDSITEGYYDAEKGGWVNRVKEVLVGDKIYNLGIAGDTTNDLLERFDVDIKDKKPDMIIFAIGINDSIYLPGERRNYVEFEKFEENLGKLIEKSRKLTSRIVFVGLTPVDEKLTNPIPWEDGMHYSNEEVKKYDGAVKKVCETENLLFVDIFTELVENDYRALLSDGLHPNSEGHDWLAKKIINKLKF